MLPSRIADLFMATKEVASGLAHRAVRLRARRTRWAVLLLGAVLTSACQDAAAPESPRVGNLSISLEGLPDGATTTVRLSRGGKFRTVSSSETLDGLDVGEWMLSAHRVVVNGITYEPSPATSMVNIPARSIRRSVGSARVVWTPTTGSLQLAVLGLPTGVLAHVTVSSTTVSRTATASSWLSGLPPGLYTIAVRDIRAPEGTMRGDVLSQTVSISASAMPMSASVSYRLAPAAVDIVVSGLPSVSAALTLISPSGQSTALGGSTRLAPVSAGRWQLLAASVQANGFTYRPTPAVHDTSVSAGDTLRFPVNYAVSSGALAIAMTGLPGGAAGSARVSGPNGFDRVVTTTTTLTDLTPGTYVVSADSVVRNGFAWRPSPLSQQVTVSASLVAAPATVAYAAVTGTLVVTLSGVPNGANGSLRVIGPYGFDRTVTANTVVTPTAAGWYTVTAAAFVANGSTYAVTPSSVNRVVAIAGRDSVEMRYVGPGVPVDTRAHAGQAQSAAASTALAVAPAVRMLDADGRGVPRMTVTFVVISGGGAVASPNTITDTLGVARSGGWTLGPVTGPQVMVARFNGLPEVTFTATATVPPASGVLAVVNGVDGQSAATAGTVAAPPAVSVRTAAGVPTAGVSVTFDVIEGGGTLTGATAVSDASGRAATQSWRLGPNAGAQRVRATAVGHTTVIITATAVASGAPTLDRTVLLRNLATPWDIAFAPDSTMVFTERSGRISAVRPGSTTPRLLAAPSNVGASGQSGMLGVAIDPAFASNRRIYTYQSFRSSSGAMDNRVVRWTVDAGWTALSNRTDIVTGIPWGNGGAHSGGRLRFGTDGFLYVASGDNRIGPIPQDLSGLGSKLLRVTTDGAGAPGNGTFPRTADARIFAYGFRNPQGLAVRANGEVFTCEHGPVHSDEVTRVVAGGNAGWDPMNPGDPTYRGYDGRWPMSDDSKFPTVLRPTWTTGTASEGMSGCTFVRGPEWRSWDGALIVGLLASRRVQVLLLTADGGSTTLAVRALEHGDRIRGVTLGPDGALYVITDGKAGGDEIWRVVPR